MSMKCNYKPLQAIKISKLKSQNWKFWHFVLKLLIWNYHWTTWLNFRQSLQCLCRLSFTWHSLYVDWLYHMLGKLCKYGRRMWLLGRCWWSRASNIIYNGSDCAGAFHNYWDILQCTGSYNGWTKDLAAALSYTCKKDADKSELRTLYYYFFCFVFCFLSDMLLYRVCTALQRVYSTTRSLGPENCIWTK